MSRPPRCGGQCSLYCCLSLQPRQSVFALSSLQRSCQYSVQNTSVPMIARQERTTPCPTYHQRHQTTSSPVTHRQPPRTRKYCHPTNQLPNRSFRCTVLYSVGPASVFRFAHSRTAPRVHFGSRPPDLDHHTSQPQQQKAVLFSTLSNHPPQFIDYCIFNPILSSFETIDLQARAPTPTRHPSHTDSCRRDDKLLAASPSCLISRAELVILAQCIVFRL